MRWLPLLWIFAGCAKSSERVRPDPTPAAAPSASSSIAKAAHVAPGDLPVCKSADDPLGAVCKLGRDAAEARFECKDPEPLMFCKNGDDWSCRYKSFLGETPPPVTYRARFDHHGPKVEGKGEIVDTKSFKRQGPVRAVEIEWSEPDETAGPKRARAFGDKLAEWGCVVSDDRKYKTTYDCGSWDAAVSYNDIIHQVIVDAALKGFLDCAY